MRNPGSTRKALGDLLRIYRLILRPLQNLRVNAVIRADRLHPGAIGAVDQNEHFSRPRYKITEHRLNYKGATALERHTHVSALSVNNLNQAFAYPAVNFNKAQITRTVVMQHRFLDSPRRGQRSRGE